MTISCCCYHGCGLDGMNLNWGRGRGWAISQRSRLRQRPNRGQPVGSPATNKFSLSQLYFLSSSAEDKELFRESLSTPTATVPEIFNGRLFRLILWMCVKNLKFAALPIPEIIGGIQKNGQSLDMSTQPFLQKFLMGFCLNGHYECTGQIWSP